MQRFSKVNMSQSRVEGPRKGNMRIFHSDSQTLPQDFNLVHHLHNLPLFLGNSLLYFSRSRNALEKHRKREWWFTEKKKKGQNRFDFLVHISYKYILTVPKSFPFIDYSGGWLPRETRQGSI